jgi:hypothetical protein
MARRGPFRSNAPSPTSETDDHDALAGTGGTANRQLLAMMTETPRINSAANMFEVNAAGRRPVREDRLITRSCEHQGELGGHEIAARIASRVIPRWASMYAPVSARW